MSGGGVVTEVKVRESFVFLRGDTLGEGANIRRDGVDAGKRHY